MISIEQRPEFFTFINDMLKVKFVPDQAICFTSLAQDGSIMGVVAVNNFTEFNCELSVASNNPRFVNRTLLDVIFHYVFITAGKTRVTAIMEDGNEAALTLNRRLGFVDEGRAKCWYGKKDGIILRMLREECRWIRGDK